MSVDALDLIEKLRKRLVDLGRSENYLRDKALSDAATEIWGSNGSSGGLVSELWVQGTFPSEQSAETLRSLSSLGSFPEDLCDYLDRTGGFAADRPLYSHQAQAFKKVTEGKKSVVITAGTGAGKTEAFLLPVLADLWKHPRAATSASMRCLILYPMNALVTDQVTRLYELLRHERQDRLSIFHFTSETPENDPRLRDGEDREPFRRWSRNSARKNIPDIVITNYSMLEYMLCRPQDQCFFGPELRHIILDEAHLYTGTLAAEITLLLRRVKDRCNIDSRQIRHIATSATLGGSRDDLRNFAAKLFSLPESDVEVVEGRRASVSPLPTLAAAPAPDAHALAATPEWRS